MGQPSTDRKRCFFFSFALFRCVLRTSRVVRVPHGDVVEHFGVRTRHFHFVALQEGQGIEFFTVNVQFFVQFGGIRSFVPGLTGRTWIGSHFDAQQSCNRDVYRLPGNDSLWIVKIQDYLLVLCSVMSSKCTRFLFSITGWVFSLIDQFSYKN